MCNHYRRCVSNCPAGKLSLLEYGGRKFEWERKKKTERVFGLKFPLFGQSPSSTKNILPRVVKTLRSDNKTKTKLPFHPGLSIFYPAWWMYTSEEEKIYSLASEHAYHPHFQKLDWLESAAPHKYRTGGPLGVYTLTTRLSASSVLMSFEHISSGMMVSFDHIWYRRLVHFEQYFIWCILSSISYSSLLCFQQHFYDLLVYFEQYFLRHSTFKFWK